MQTIGVPTFYKTTEMQTMVQRTKSLLQTAQTESVTGRVADLVDGTRGDVGKVHKLQKLQADSDRLGISLETLKLEFEFVQDILTPIQERSSELTFEILGALELNDATSLDTARIQAEQELRSTFDRLNTAFGGKNLFSGAAVDTSPLASVETLLTDVEDLIANNPDLATINAALDDYFLNDDKTFGTGGAPNDGFASTIYQGSTAAGPTREVSPGQRLSVDLKPTDPVFRDAIRAFAVLSKAQTAGSEDITKGLMREAANLLGQVNNAVISKQTELGTVQAEIELMVTRNRAAGDAYARQLNAYLEVDQFEAASRLNNLETQLQATYLVTSRIQNLSLVNFL